MMMHDKKHRKMKYKFDENESQMMDKIHDSSMFVVPISLSFECDVPLFYLTIVTISIYCVLLCVFFVIYDSTSKNMVHKIS